MSNKLRNLERMAAKKNHKEFSYRQYLMQRSAEARDRKKSELKSKFEERINEAIFQYVPKWAVWLSKFCIPSAWYRKIIEWFLNKIYGPKEKKLLAERLLTGKISYPIYSRWIMANIIYKVTYQWMLWLSKQFKSFGIRAKVKVISQGVINFKIYYLFKCVEEEEITI